MKHSEILIAARQLLLDKGWTQGTFAKDKNGNSVHSKAPTAVCFCASGAIRVASGDKEPGEARYFLFRALGGPIPVWNDVEGRTLDEVLQKFDEAIALAKSEGK